MVKRRPEAEEEEAFPRGRAGYGDAADAAGARGEPSDAAAGKAPAARRPAPDAAPLSKKRKKAAAEGGAKVGPQADEAEDDATMIASPHAVRSVPLLRPQHLSEGTMLVAAVREVVDEEVTLNLPYNMVGYVSRAQAVEQACASDVRPLPKLSALYQPGQLVVAVVLSLQEVGRRQRVELSLRPSLANAGLDAGAVCQHMWLPAAVRDEEEHVLRLDFGVHGLTGLLKKAELAGSAAEAVPGRILQVAVQSAGTGTVRCTLKAPPCLSDAPLPKEALKAGFLVQARVDKVLAPPKGSQASGGGLVATFCGSVMGLVHSHSQGPAVKAKQHVTARVLAVVPGPTVTVHLTLLPHLLDWSSQAAALSDVKIGDRISADVVDSTPRYGCRVRRVVEDAATGGTGDGIIAGFCPSSRLSDKDSEQAVERLEAGSTMACRVLGYNYLDGSLIVTRRPYDMKETTLVSVAELSPGQLVTGVIARTCDFGVFVKLSEYVTGLVNLRQLTDVPLSSVGKKFQVDAKIKCRVLRVDMDKKQVSLTAKKSMVKDDFQLVEFSQARRDMLVTGYVVNMQSYGAIVRFYGSLHGLLPASKVQEGEMPAVGMVVHCRISFVNRKRKTLELSLDLEGGRPASEFRLGEAGVRGPGPGEVARAVRAVRCTAGGVVVRFRAPRPGAAGEVPPGEGAEGASDVRFGFVPLAHLADEADDCAAKHAELAGELGGVQELIGFDAQESGKGVKVGAEGVVLAKRFSPLSASAAGDGAEGEAAKGEVAEGKAAEGGANGDASGGGEDGGKDQGSTKNRKRAAGAAPSYVLVSLKSSMHAAVQEGTFVTDLSKLEESKTYAGYIKDVKEFGALVSVGSWRLSGLAPKGLIAAHFVERPERELRPGQSVRVLVSKVEADRNRFTADLRPAKRDEVPVVRRQVGAEVTMRVRSVRGLEVVCAAPGGINGHVHATHLVDLPSEGGGDEAKMPLESIKKGKMLRARVMRLPKRAAGEGDGPRKVEHFELTCRPSLMKEGLEVGDYESAVIKWGSLKRGRRLIAVVSEVRKSGMWVEVAPNIRGRVAPLDASADMGTLQDLPAHFQVGQVLAARVLRVSAAQKQLDLTLHGQGDDDTKELPKGSKVLARLEKVESIAGRGVAASFILPGRLRGFAHVTELFDFWAQHPIKRLRPRTVYEARVVGADAAEGGGAGRLELSLRASAVFGQKEGPGERRPLSVSDVTVGQKVTGYVVNANDKGVFVALSRSLVARIRLKALSDRVVARESVAKLHPPGSLIREATVAEVDEEGKRVELSLRAGGANQGLTIEQLSVGDVVSGRVKAVEKYGVFIRVDNSQLDGLAHISEVSDTASVTLDSFKNGDQVRRAKVLKIEGPKLWLGLKPSLFEGEADDEEEDEDAAEDDENDGEGAAPAANTDAPAATPAAPPAGRGEKRPRVAKAAEAAAVADSDEEAPWEKAAVAAASGAGAGRGEAAFVFADFRASMPSDSEDEVQDDDGVDTDGGAKRPSKRQKKAAKAQQAEALRQREAEIAEGRAANDPRSVEDFERLLLTEGDSSIVWIRYMAFHLKTSDLEKARQVAERAIKHVGFSEAQERFNAWVAFMNLECTFGTEESADVVVKRAASHNDAKDVYLQLARIHERNKKPQVATKVYETTCKKFPHSQTVWLAFLSFLYQQGDLEGGRKTLPKCLAALPRAKHPLVVSKTAILEYNHGSVERGRSIFEGLLDSYPKRTDLWSVYLDAHIRAHTPPRVAQPELAQVRSLLERCCTLTLKAVKMRFFFKRWLDFEKRWGDEESQEKVRAKARAFVESAGA